MVQACAAKLWAELLSEYPDELALFVQELFAIARCASLQPAQTDAAAPLTSDNLLAKDAVYAALGYNLTRLGPAIDFGAWLASSLSQELANPDPQSVPLDRLALTPQDRAHAAKSAVGARAMDERADRQGGARSTTRHARHLALPFAAGRGRRAVAGGVLAGAVRLLGL